MRLWRVCRRKHGAAPLSGRGGVDTPGRWHLRGTRIVYTSATLSLAALEILVHTDKDLAPTDLVQIEIEVPDNLKVERVDAASLPTGWRRYPAPLALQQLGTDWIGRGRTALLRVPSAVIPEESNYLLNPGHPDAGKVKMVGKREFVLDPRLLS